jgi:hypothetical protein
MNSELDVLRRVVDYHDHISAPPVPLADDLRRGRGRVRRQRGLLVGGVAVGLASVVAVVSLVTGGRAADRPEPAGPPGLTTPLVAPRSMVDIREAGFHVEPAPGFEVTDSWGLDPDLQRTDVVLGDGGARVTVTVYYEGRLAEASSTGAGEAVTVNGDAGTYDEEDDGEFWSARLAWEYAPDSWAEVTARGNVPAPPDLRSRFVAVAEAVRSGGPPVRVPVRFGTVPASLPDVATGHSLSVEYAGGAWSWWLSVDDISIWATSREDEECLGSEGQPPTGEFRYHGHPGCVVAGERLGLHLDNASVFFDYGPSPELPMEDMKTLLGDLTVASDDPATWFDLETAMGG